MTMVDTLHDAHYGSREKLAWAFAEILNDEARAIAHAGVDVIQFDEPAFNVYFDEVRDWGVAALERAAANLDCTTAVHICYGYGIKANIDWKKTLGSEWRQVRTDVSAPCRLEDRPGVARVRAFPRAARADRASRERTCWWGQSMWPPIGWKPRKRWRVSSARRSIRARRPSAALHQLRHGAAGPGRGPGQASRPGSRDRPGSPGIDVLNGPGRVDRASGRMPRLARDSAQQENACQAETYRFTAEITV